MNFRRVLDVRPNGRRSGDTRMAAVEDPTSFHPDAIADGGPDELWNRSPNALEALALVHQACAVPLDFHLRVMTSRAGREVRADFARDDAIRAVKRSAQVRAERVRDIGKSRAREPYPR